MTASPDPLRRLAQERGRILGELGARPEDERWARLEAEPIANLATRALRLRLAGALERLIRRLRLLAR
ncbi:MAG: hypothetical protein ABI968_04005 [Acidobacteriota bacterium]